MARRAVYKLLGAAFGSIACSLIVDTSEIDAGCGEGMKVCFGACVKIDDPAYGCSPTECKACDDGEGDFFGDKRLPTCDGSECVTDTCAFGFGCDDCTVPILSDPMNCGKCRELCDEGFICLLGVCRDPNGAGGARAEAGN